MGRNDQFQDLGGYDTWRFGAGDGQDTIADNYGRVLFKPGIGQNDVSFTRDGNDDLIATVTASGDAVRVKRTGSTVGSASTPSTSPTARA